MCRTNPPRFPVDFSFFADRPGVPAENIGDSGGVQSLPRPAAGLFTEAVHRNALGREMPAAAVFLTRLGTPGANWGRMAEHKPLRDCDLREPNSMPNANL